MTPLGCEGDARRQQQKPCAPVTTVTVITVIGASQLVWGLCWSGAGGVPQKAADQLPVSCLSNGYSDVRTASIQPVN